MIELLSLIEALLSESARTARPEERTALRLPQVPAGDCRADRRGKFQSASASVQVTTAVSPAGSPGSPQQSAGSPGSPGSPGSSEVHHCTVSQ